MATLGYVVPETSVQSTETFHALRRTVPGMLYYTKVNKDESVTIDFDGGSPTDKNGNIQLPSLRNYVEDVISLQPGETEYFTGDGSTTQFTMSGPVLDDTRLAVYVDGNLQVKNVNYTYASPIVTFNIIPKSGAQVAIGKINKKYKNNDEDFYHQYVFESGEATYFVDDNGYFVKRENLDKILTSIAIDDFETFESTSTINSTTWQSAV